MTLRPLQHWFENMSSRERFMLMAFVWVGILLWGSVLLKQINALKTDMKSKNVTLEGQKISLDQQHAVEDKINNYNKIFQKSISSAALVSMVNGFVSQSQMPRPTITSTRTTGQKDSVFNINTVTVNFNRVPFLDLVHFISLVHTQKPYLVIDEVKTTPENINPTLMDGMIRINSLELKPHALDAASAQPATSTAK